MDWYKSRTRQPEGTKRRHVGICLTEDDWKFIEFHARAEEISLAAACSDALTLWIALLQKASVVEVYPGDLRTRFGLEQPDDDYVQRWL